MSPAHAHPHPYPPSPRIPCVCVLHAWYTTAAVVQDVRERVGAHWDARLLPIVERFFWKAKLSGVPELYAHLPEADRVAYDEAMERMRKV
jgi:hypothetical protein